MAQLNIKLPLKGKANHENVTQRSSNQEALLQGLF